MTWRSLHPVGKFFIAIFLIVMFEGAVRKWIWGSATIPLLGLRDLIVVYAIFWGFVHRYFKARAPGESILIFWTVLILVWTAIQMISGLQPAIVGAIGFRFWVLYLWFALLCAKALNWQDIEYLFKLFSLTLLFMVPRLTSHQCGAPGRHIHVIYSSRLAPASLTPTCYECT